ncbi:MAG: hypothetical protein WB983_05555 [Terriglobales bacterium]
MKTNKVYVLTHTKKQRTRLLGVFTTEITDRILQHICDEQGLNPLECFAQLVPVDKAVTA